MDKKEFNEKAITDVYKNAHIALQSISDLLPDINDEDIKTELKDQYEGYEKIIGEISSYMTENGIEPIDINFMKKAMLWSSIKMTTIFDNSRNKIAEIMIKGTVTGINELAAMNNESENLDEGVKRYIEKLLALEESYEKKLREFL